jgi:predicted outer membrane repeat protein
MTYKSILAICFLSIFSMSLSGQVFVKHDASGANDGTSWDNAYTNLADALTTISDQAIWVASGTYHPTTVGATADSVWFFLDRDVQLYGGFAGTEDRLSQRDFMANPTILSADLDRDDIPNDFVNNRSDNALHVMLIDSAVTNACLIDGFTIQAGHSRDNPPGGQPDNWDFYYGSGILTFGAPVIRNCRFTQNYGYYGAALGFSGMHTTGTLLDSCTFENNQSSAFGGAIFGSNGDDLVISNSQFLNNSGGAVVLINVSGQIDGCTFSQNQSDFGGAIACLNDNRDAICSITNCAFFNNSVTLSGGAIIAAGFHADYLVQLNVSGSTFTDNQGDGDADGVGDGGALAIQGYANLELTSSTLSGNTAIGGGAVVLFFGGQGNIADCLFELNDAQLYGGAIDIVESDNELRRSRAEVRQSTFRSNRAGDSGGAILAYRQGSATIEQCEFIGNQTLYGGGIGFLGTPSGDFAPKLKVDACVFRANHAELEGGGIDFADAVDVEIGNSLFTQNTGPGAAIYSFTNPGFTCNSFVFNNTIADNEAGIYLRENPTMVLQNNIFANPEGTNYGNEDGAQVSSGGGNLSSDYSLELVLAEPSDRHETDPLFAGEDDYHLSAESPGIDAGIATNISALHDLDGHDRIRGNGIDIGAYESPFTVDTEDYHLSNKGQLTLFPNPATDYLNLRIDHRWRGSIWIELLNVQGQIVYSEQHNKTQAVWVNTLSVSHLPSGGFTLRVRTPYTILSKEWIKL